MTADCIFCKIAQGAIPAKTLYEDDDIIAFWDISPQAPKHFLIIPKLHVSGPSALSPEHDGLIGLLLRKAGELARDNGIEDFRYVINNGAEAGQTVFHLHLHVLGGRPMGWPPG